MALYRNKVLVSGIRDYPAMTWAEYQALPVAQRPKKWICTDRDYTEIPWGDNLLTQNLTVNHQTDATLPIAEPLQLNHLYSLSYNGTQGYNDSVLFAFTGNTVSISCMASVYSSSPIRILLTRSSKGIYWSLLSGTTTATITITSIRMVK